MRKLLDQEKEICKLILENKGSYNVLPNFLDSKLQDVRVTINFLEKKVTISYHKSVITAEDRDKIIDRIKEVYYLLVLTSKLIVDLEKEGYILAYNEANNVDDVQGFGRGPVNVEGIPYNYPDEDVNDILIHYINKNINITPDFEDFCAKGFRDVNARRDRRNSILTIISVGIAFLVGIASIVVGYKGLYNQANDRYQEDVRGSLKKMRESLDLISNNSNLIIKMQNKDTVQNPSNKSLERNLTK